MAHYKIRLLVFVPPMRSILRALLILMVAALPLRAQIGGPPGGNAQNDAATVTAACLARLNATAVRDITLRGRARFGPNTAEIPVTLVATPDGSYRIDFATGAVKSEVFTASDAGRAGWIDLSGTVHELPRHVALAAAPWFSPALAMLSRIQSTRGTLSETAGPSTAATVQVVLARSTGSNTRAQAVTQRLTAITVVIDRHNHLPFRLKFDSHPNETSRVDIPTEVTFSDYRNVAEIPTPFHIEKRMNGGLVLEINVDEALVNSGARVSPLEGGAQ